MFHALLLFTFYIRSLIFINLSPLWESTPGQQAGERSSPPPYLSHFRLQPEACPHVDGRIFNHKWSFGFWLWHRTEHNAEMKLYGTMATGEFDVSSSKSYGTWDSIQGESLKIIKRCLKGQKRTQSCIDNISTQWLKYQERKLGHIHILKIQE